MVLGLVVVVFLAGWARAVATSPDLRFTDIVVSSADPAHEDAIHTVNGRLGREVELDFVRAGRFDVLLDLVNEGHRGVRIEDLPGDGDWGQRGTSHRRWTSAAVGRRDVAQPTESPTLGRGESITVRFAFAFPDAGPHAGCMMSPDQTRSLPVTYRKLGFGRTRWMPLQEAYLSTFTGPRCDENLRPAPPS